MLYKRVILWKQGLHKKNCPALFLYIWYLINQIYWNEAIFYKKSPFKALFLYILPLILTFYSLFSSHNNLPGVFCLSAFFIFTIIIIISSFFLFIISIIILIWFCFYTQYLEGSPSIKYLSKQIGTFSGDVTLPFLSMSPFPHFHFYLCPPSHSSIFTLQQVISAGVNFCEFHCKKYTKIFCGFNFCEFQISSNSKICGKIRLSSCSWMKSVPLLILSLRQL